MADDQTDWSGWQWWATGWQWTTGWQKDEWNVGRESDQWSAWWAGVGWWANSDDWSKADHRELCSLSDKQREDGEDDEEKPQDEEHSRGVRSSPWHDSGLIWYGSAAEMLLGKILIVSSQTFPMVEAGWSSQRTGTVASYVVAVAPGLQRFAFKYLEAPNLIFWAEREADGLLEFGAEQIFAEVSNGGEIVSKEIYVLEISSN